MSFNAEQRKISDILSADFRYVIPRYQRKYVWEEKQWRELLEDLKYCLENDKAKPQELEWTHFLGSFVFERKASGEKEFYVIDGQQRLTTIIIMLCAICVLYNEQGVEDRFKGVLKYILGSNDFGEPCSRVDNQELENYSFLVAEATTYNPLQSKGTLLNGTFLKSSTKDNVNVKHCFHFYYNQFVEMISSGKKPVEELTKIKNKILNLDVIEIRASNQQESYNIFEILNARGVDLKQHELIKNYIFKYIKPQASIDTAKLKWDAMEKKLYIAGRTVMDFFFTHYVTHKYEKPEKENSEFRIIKSHCDRNEMSTLLDDLCEKADYYRWFYIPSECEDLIIREALQFFLDNNHRQFRPVFLSIISAYKKSRISLDAAHDFFNFIRKFYFAYGVVCGGTSNTIQDMIYTYARRIERENSEEAMRELIEKLKTYYPPYQHFQDSFLMLGYSNTSKSYKTSSKKKEVQYILRKIEEFYLQKNNELQVCNFTIEHIASDDGTDSHCHIGNLLPLAEPLNEKAANNPLKEKRNQYLSSDFKMVKNFLSNYQNVDEWDDRKIEERGKHLAKLAYETIWRI